MSRGNKGLNSNGVGVLLLFHLTITFRVSGNEVWNDTLAFFAQPPRIQRNSFLPQRTKQEHHPTPQNPKMTRKRKTIFPLFQGETQSVPQKCTTKWRNTPLESWFKSVLWFDLVQVLLEQEPVKPVKPPPTDCQVLQSSDKKIEKGSTQRQSSVSPEHFPAKWTTKTPTPLELRTRFPLNFFHWTCSNWENQPSS